jgi:hypothetical protein
VSKKAFGACRERLGIHVMNDGEPELAAVVA